MLLITPGIDHEDSVDLLDPIHTVGDGGLLKVEIERGPVTS